MAKATKDILLSLIVLDSSTTTLLSTTSVTGDGSLVVSTLVDNYLRWSLTNLPTGFNNPDMWKKINVMYSPVVAGTEQTKMLSFRKRNSTYTCLTSWDSYLVKGSWKVSKVYITNKMGEVHQEKGTSFSVNNNITVS